MSAAQLAFVFPITATFEEVSTAIALHFGGKPINLSTGEEEDETQLRDATAVFTGVASASTHTVSTGTSVATATPVIELDKEGLPWDERIHSSTKSKNEDGKWKLRKGMGNSAQLPLIKAELLQKVAAMGATPAQSGVPTPAQSAAPIAEQANLHNTTESATAARIAYAHEQAIIAAGPMTMLTEEQFDKLKRGVMVEVLPAGLDWFKAYREASNAAYQAYANATLAKTESDLAGTVHMNTQAINPNAPAGIVQIAGAAPQPDAPIVDFAGFAVKYATLDPATLAEVLTPLGIAGGLAGLATAPAMIPAVVAMLKARGL